MTFRRSFSLSIFAAVLFFGGLAFVKSGSADPVPVPGFTCTDNGNCAIRPSNGGGVGGWWACTPNHNHNCSCEDKPGGGCYCKPY